MSNALTSQDFVILQQYVAGGDRYDYWNYLANKGDAYAKLALGVVTGNSLQGFVANNYASSFSTDPALTNQNTVTLAWWGIGDALMAADFATRKSLPNAGDSSLNLSFQTILGYHQKVFSNNGLPVMAWTPYIPFESYINSGNWTAANTAWQQMIGGSDLIASLTGLLNSGGASAGDKGTGLAEVTGITAEYGVLIAMQGSTRISLTNANFIANPSSLNGWSYGQVPGRRSTSRTPSIS